MHLVTSGSGICVVVIEVCRPGNIFVELLVVDGKQDHYIEAKCLYEYPIKLLLKASGFDIQTPDLEKKKWLLSRFQFRQR